MIRCIKAAFEILKAHYFRTSVVTARGYTHSPNLWQEHHHQAKDALRSTKKGERNFTSIWDRWQNNETCRESQLAIDWSNAWVRYLDHIAQIDISQKRRKNNDVDTTIYFIYEVLTKVGRHHFYHKDQGTNKQRTHKSRCKGNRDKIWDIYLKK